MGRYYVNGHQSKETRQLKYRLAREAGVNVEWARRIRNWTTPHWMLFIKSKIADDIKNGQEDSKKD